MRLFISIPITERVTEKLFESLKSVKQTLKGKHIRYQPPQKWHFTIVFLGEQPKKDVNDIKKSLDAVSSSVKPPNVSITGIQYGPNPKNPRMIWARTDRNTSERLGQIREKFREQLDNSGIQWKKSKWKYKGHITLARFEPEDLQNPPDIDTDINLEFTPEEIELKKSVLSPQGAQYSTLHEARLS